MQQLNSSNVIFTAPINTENSSMENLPNSLSYSYSLLEDKKGEMKFIVENNLGYQISSFYNTDYEFDFKPIAKSMFDSFHIIEDEEDPGNASAGASPRDFAQRDEEIQNFSSSGIIGEYENARPYLITQSAFITQSKIINNEGEDAFDILDLTYENKFPNFKSDILEIIPISLNINNSSQAFCEKIYSKLNKVIEPEIGTSIIELSLVEDVFVGNNTAEIYLHLTNPFAPAKFGFKIACDIKNQVEYILEIDTLTLHFNNHFMGEALNKFINEDYRPGDCSLHMTE